MPTFGIPSMQGGFGGGQAMFGSPTDDQAIANLSKAMNSSVGVPAMGGGPALQLENLDATLRVVAAQLSNIRLWNMMPKFKASAIAYQYNLLRDYGADNGVFTGEAELAQIQDSNYQRRIAEIKFLSVQREISYQATLTNRAHGDPVALETKNGTIDLLQKLEKQLFVGNSAIIPQAFDGIDAQMFADEDFYPSNVIDLRGQFPTEDEVESGANKIVERYGTPTHFLVTPAVRSAIGKQYFPRLRGDIPAMLGRVGFSVSHIDTSAGLLELVGNVFQRPGSRNGNKQPPSAATSPFAPAAPTSLAGTAAAGTGSYFTAGEAGEYRYWATAVNRWGESAPTQITADIAIAAGQSTTLTAVAADNITDGFKLYRAPADSDLLSEAQLMSEIPANASYVDNNLLLPGHGRLYMIQNDANNYGFAMLSPLLKFPLAPLAMSQRWMMALFGTPVVFSPQRNVIYINAPDSNTNVF